MGVVEQGSTKYITVALEPESCCQCGIAFGMTDAFKRYKRGDGSCFYCPSGHPQHYTETTEQKLRKQVAAAEQKWSDEVDRNRRLDRQLIASRGQVTKIKNRVANGICPCCNRTFVNLQRHMGTKHPDYKDQELP